MTGSSNDHKVYGSDVLLFNVIPMWILFAAKSVLIGFVSDKVEQVDNENNL